MRGEDTLPALDGSVRPLIGCNHSYYGTRACILRRGHCSQRACLVVLEHRRAALWHPFYELFFLCTIATLVMPDM